MTTKITDSKYNLNTLDTLYSYHRYKCNHNHGTHKHLWHHPNLGLTAM